MPQTDCSLRSGRTDGILDGVLHISRWVDATRAQIIRAFTEPDQYRQWFGSRETIMTHCELEPRLGGVLHYNHRMADGDEVWIHGKYIKVEPEVRLAFRCHFSDEEGALVRLEPFPEETDITITFIEDDGKTLVAVEHSPVEKDRGEWQGWIDSFDRLEELLGY